LFLSGWFARPCLAVDVRFDVEVRGSFDV